jgi:hypothetical protein
MLYETCAEDIGGTLLPFDYRRLARPIRNLQSRCKLCAREGMDRITAQWANIAMPAVSPMLPPSHNLIRAKVYKTEHAWTGSRRRNKGGAVLGGTSPRWSAMATFGRR